MASESTTNLVSKWGRKDSGVSDLVGQTGTYWKEEHPKFEIGCDINEPISESDDSDQVSTKEIEFPPSIASSEEESKWIKFQRTICPPRGQVAKWITWCIVLLLIFGMVWSVAPGHLSPGHNEFGLLVTILLCFSAEVLIVKIPTCKGFPPLPKLLASLLMGLALANLPAPVNVASYILPHWSWTLRTMSLAVILTRAGLELDSEAMMRVKWAVVRLAFLPCLGETFTIGIVAHYILGFPFVWSFMMGFLIAAVSPAVVIPSLIILQEKGLGRKKGIPSLVMAASGIDDVLAIAGFTVLLGIAMPAKLEAEIVGETFAALPPQIDDNEVAGSEHNVTCNMNATEGEDSENKIGRELAGALVEVVIGVVAGLVCGFFISYFPHKDMKYKSFCRGTLLLGIGIFAVFASDYWGIPGSGALWALITSFVAALHWKKECKPLERTWHYMWVVFQPILFGLTGATVDVNTMDAETVGLGLAVLAIGLVVRIIVSTSVTWGLNFNVREKLFISIAWIPKGTVQAALGSAALDTAYELQRPCNEIRWSQQILVLAVLVTLITAPIGAFGINFSGPKLLSASSNEEDNENCASDGESGFGSDKRSTDEKEEEICNYVNEAFDEGDPDATRV